MEPPALVLSDRYLFDATSGAGYVTLYFPARALTWLSMYHSDLLESIPQAED
jgi:hypothetical protein